MIHPDDGDAVADFLAEVEEVCGTNIMVKVAHEIEQLTDPFDEDDLMHDILGDNLWR
jgi:hypothetical protein